MKLSHKNLLSYGIYMIIIIASIFIIDYVLIRNHLRKEAENEIKQECEAVHRSIQNSLNLSIENYLRGITESNLDIVKYYYNQYKKGELTESEAKDAIQTHCDKQSIGKSGYFVAVENTDGRLILDIHPYKRHEDCSDLTGCVVWDSIRSGYAEYDWKNPEDDLYRKKVAYIREFPEWNWIFGATSYKGEFIQLLSVNDLKKILSAVKIKSSGYASLLDKNKKTLFHPMYEKYKDEAFITAQSDVIERILTSSDEIVFYPWKNPEDDAPRKKYAYKKIIPEFDFYLVVTGYMDEIYSPLERIIQITMILSVSAILLLLVSVFYNSRSVVKPVSQIINSIQQFNTKGESFTVPKTSVNEIKSLAISFQNMTEEIITHRNHLETLVSDKTKELGAANEALQATNEELYGKNEFIKEQNQELTSTLQHLKETQAQLLQSEKMASLGILTAGVAHEINNPLNYIMGAYVGLLHHYENNTFSENREQVGTLINAMKVGIDRSTAIIQGLNLFSRKSDSYAEDCNVHEIIDNSLTMLHNQIKHTITVEKEFADSDIIIKGNVGSLHQLFINVLINAVQAIESKGTISIKTEPDKSGVIVKIADTGTGISTEDLQKITDPFFTTKDPGKGTGLGLSITYNIIKEHDGTIEFESEKGKGTTVVITLPNKDVC